MSKLVLHVPGGGTRDIELDRDRITLGRRADNDVHLPYPAVSAEHAAVITVLEDSFLEDLQSTNGTLVNGKRITKHFLRDHDQIDVGRVQLVYCANDDEVIEPIESEVEARRVPVEATPSAEVSSHPETGSGASAAESRLYDIEQANDLFAQLMNSSSEAAVAVDIPSPLSTVSPDGESRRTRARLDVTSGVYLEVVNGPNAGQIAPMVKREFVLGRAGATNAVIRRDGELFMLVPQGDAPSSVNGRHVPPEGVPLSFGDHIEVAGVKLRFGRRPPLEGKRQ